MPETLSVAERETLNDFQVMQEQVNYETPAHMLSQLTSELIEQKASCSAEKPIEQVCTFASRKGHI